MTIQTYNEIKKEWKDCEHKSWEELKADGWVFACQDDESNVIMSKKGYINTFRNKDETILQTRSDTMDSVINAVLCYTDNDEGKVEVFKPSKESLIRLRQLISTIIDNEGKEMR